MEDRKTLPLVVKRVKHQAPEPKKGRDPHCVAVGERLRKLREQSRMTHQEVADAVGQMRGAKRSVIGKWERGESWPRSDALRKLCDLFRVSADWLLSDAEDGDVLHVSRSGVRQLARAASTGTRDLVPVTPLAVAVDDDTILIHGRRDVELFRRAIDALRDRGSPDDIANALAWVEGSDD